MSTFRAIRVDKSEAGYNAAFVDFDEADLMDGEVTIRVSHSSVNYKDGLAITGRSPVVRKFPMIPGIDLAGIVEASRHPDFRPGDRVAATGGGLSEIHFGGYAQKARLPAAWLVHLPGDFTAAQAMAIGTAGFTAALCVLTLEQHGMKPADGPVIVTGAAGGVGSVAMILLAKAGWHVIASTGRPQEAAYLRDLGAAEVIDRTELNVPGRPLGKERWAAGVDTIGSHTLANLLSQTKYGGAIAATGLAGGMDLPTTVAPFILRNVALLGVDSGGVSRARRLAGWERLARDLDREKLAEMTNMVPFSQVMETARDILDGKVRGRVVVEIGG